MLHITKVIFVSSSISSALKFWSLIYTSVYAVVIALCRVQYGKYFSSFSYFATYFRSIWASELIAKYEKQGKYLLILHEATSDNYFILKCFFKSNRTRVISLTYLLACLLGCLLASLLACLPACLLPFFLPSFLTYLLTYLLTHWLTYLLTHLLTCLLTYSLTYLLTASTLLSII